MLSSRVGERGSRTVMGFQEAYAQVSEGQYGQGFGTVGVVHPSAMSHGSENHLGGNQKESLCFIGQNKTFSFVYHIKA